MGLNSLTDIKFSVELAILITFYGSLSSSVYDKISVMFWSLSSNTFLSGKVYYLNEALIFSVAKSS